MPETLVLAAKGTPVPDMGPDMRETMFLGSKASKHFIFSGFERDDLFFGQIH
jgi:hypothetical protein